MSRVWADAKVIKGKTRNKWKVTENAELLRASLTRCAATTDKSIVTGKFPLAGYIPKFAAK
jgi:hypothetical protein